MPELPELQAHAERLTAAVGGRVLERFQAMSFTALKTVTPPPEVALGHLLVAVRRRGKYLLLDVQAATFVVHLMQGGRLRPDEKLAARPRGALARWLFADGSGLLLTEAGRERRAGIWVIEGDPLVDEPLADLGPEADAVPRDELERRLRGVSMRVHGFLRDQRCIAGIGRRLANEICHRAGLSPFANTANLDSDEIDRLHVAIRRCIGESLAYERDRDDMSHSKERLGAVHHREGQPCPVCSDTIRSVSYSTYTVNYCPACQTAGKVLADNTTSKFLK
ncbi:DNA-formamidopyrimidine glycosylase family protein [Rhabdothermincola sediminis]|uniref:DNA-formamidopyrimidine glycosylase family protein n=1 Tax=Rhabdothermincola sediminis TaxID=2751370 RepID=UPI001AA0A6EE|nr:DNA-formamidopyrimidine glycosylase family protein [Rhabdothermincola sediminis]